jgi:competence ComEA-like helix-hairpin-helix protein
MNWRDFFLDYLNFSRKERIAAIVIVFLIFLIWLSPTLLRSVRSQQNPSDSSWIDVAEKLQANQNERSKSRNEDSEPLELAIPEKKIENPRSILFDFDPNQATDEDWEKLGLHIKTIRTIKNFLAHGGRFRKPEDLKKIYGLSQEEYVRLEPFIKIEAGNQNIPAQQTDLEKRFSEKKISKLSVEINSADTTAFISLPGIGGKLAARIVNFREKLGGFYSIEQVGETYGLSDSTFQIIKSFLTVTNIDLKKININTSTKEELKIHPYLKWNLANAIVEYRNQHGNFSSVDDLKKISAVTDDVFEKVKNYLTVN